MRLSILLLAALTGFAQVRFGATGNTSYGVWSTDVTVTPDWWSPGQTLEVTAELRVTDMHIANLAAANYKLDSFLCLLTAERTFDRNGNFRQANDERASTLITPTGLPIEGGVQGAVTNRFGGAFKTPIDLFAKVALKDARQQDGVKIITFTFRQEIPKTIPPGIYRVRLDYGFGAGTRNYSLDAGTFAARPFFKSTPVESHLYLPPIRVNGYTIDGSWLDAGEIKPRLPWVLLYNYNSNGYRGVVAEEDQHVFGLSGRNLIQDDIILPLFDANNNKIAYSLEPQLFTDTIELRSNIPWNPYGGSLTCVITGPDGETRTIGPLGHHGLTQNLWPSTRRSQLTMWRPQKYGLYTVKLTGVWEDTWGNRYEGGGTYQFWIAKRMTMATATFQGQAYPVGNRYGRDMQFNPAFPADVEVEASLLINSDPNQKQTVRYRGKASPSGLFGAAQGMVALPFTAPGEYCAKVLAKHIDENGHLWVSSMRHAGVVYPVDSPIVARGKKLLIDGKYVDRGETRREGYSIPSGASYLDHINFPYNQNDVLLIASEGEGANKIIPTLLWEPRENAPAYTTKYQSIGHSNVALQTSNGLSPHLFPEYITEWNYFYAAAPRPGFMGRFLVAEHNARAPYWSTSPNGFGGQINASNNGDLTGDIYRLLGGIVLRKSGEAPLYAGYLASAFLLPGKSNNNRIVAAGSEDLPGPFGKKARFFLVGTRPGLVYETGTAFAPAFQIDPVLPVNITYTLTCPDGKVVSWSGTGDAGGSWVGATRHTLDQPGVYRYSIQSDWQGHAGHMPGLPPQGGEFYVIEKSPPPTAPQLNLELTEDSTMDPLAGRWIRGTTTASEVYFATLIPGAVLEEGFLPVNNGRFEYHVDPKKFSQLTNTYDTENRVSGRAEIGDVLHITLFTREQGPDGAVAHRFARVLVRGTKMICVK